MQKQTVSPTFNGIMKSEGTGALLKGIRPRVIWISLGGAIFLGMGFRQGDSRGLVNRVGIPPERIGGPGHTFWGNKWQRT